MMHPETRPRVPTSLTIVEAVAAQEGVDPMELEPPLFDVMDPEALEALLSTGATAKSNVTVAFEWADYDIVVGSDGTLIVERRGTRVNPPTHEDGF